MGEIEKALAFDIYKMSDNGDDLKKRLDSSFKKLYAQYSGTDDSSQSSQPATTPNEDDDDDIMCHYRASLSLFSHEDIDEIHRLEQEITCSGSTNVDVEDLAS
ncbi:hypothetical protein P8452_66571 [Trifolium repens]|nr:hypothetical protein P8452_66571 [Trifolium repens]